MLLAYGIAWQDTPLPDRLGILDHPLAWIAVDDLAVLVEPGFEAPVLAGWGESQWLAAALAHAAVVQSVFAKATILPIALRSGFWADVPTVCSWLQEQGSRWAARLRELAGCGEVTVRAWPVSSPLPELAGRAYFAAKRERSQGLAKVQEVLRAHSRDFRVRSGEEALRWDLLVTAAQLADLRTQTAQIPGWQVQLGEWLPPYGFV
ncbi:MAG: GvpL/GvpF family gas vesicle protein [Pseudanabaenaceae cyanobacterium]